MAFPSKFNSKEDLVKHISAIIGKPKVLELTRILIAQRFALRDLIDITFIADEAVAFRAAWIMENIFFQDPDLFVDNFDYFLSRFQDVKHDGCQRHYTRIVMFSTDPNAPDAIKNKLASRDLEPVVEQCFDWLIHPKAKIALKVFASEALFNLRHRYPWVTEELKNQIEFMLRTGSPAIQARGKKLLSQF